MSGLSWSNPQRIGVFRVTVADEEPELAGPVAEVHQQVAGLLGYPRAGRVPGGASTCTVQVDSSTQKKT
jgi:hypothetical protein